MKFQAEINVMPHKGLLDPQGKAVNHGITSLGINVENVRVGKHITFEIEAAGKDEAREKAELVCKKLLANPVMESFEISIQEYTAQ